MRILYIDYWAFGEIMIMGSESQQLWLRVQTQVDHFAGNSPISPVWFVPYTHTRLLWSHLSCEVARMYPETRNRHGLSPLITVSPIHVIFIPSLPIFILHPNVLADLDLQNIGCLCSTTSSQLGRYASNVPNSEADVPILHRLHVKAS